MTSFPSINEITSGLRYYVIKKGNPRLWVTRVDKAVWFAKNAKSRALKFSHDEAIKVIRQATCHASDSEKSKYQTLLVETPKEITPEFLIPDKGIISADATPELVMA